MYIYIRSHFPRGTPPAIMRNAIIPSVVRCHMYLYTTNYNPPRNTPTREPDSNNQTTLPPVKQWCSDAWPYSYYWYSLLYTWYFNGVKFVVLRFVYQQAVETPTLLTAPSNSGTEQLAVLVADSRYSSSSSGATEGSASDKHQIRRYLIGSALTNKYKLKFQGTARILL